MDVNKSTVFEDFTEQLEADRSRTRNVDVDGEKFVVKAEDPYGLWKIRRLRGRTPDSLLGAYTSAFEAEKAINAYLLANPSKKPSQEKKTT